MSFTSNPKNEGRVRGAARRIFNAPEEKYTPEYIELHNSSISAEPSKYSKIVQIYKRWGYLSLVAFAFFKIIEALIMNIAFATNPLSNGATVASILISLPITVSLIGIFAYAFIWISYWLCGMWHCSVCDGFFTMRRVYEKHIPNMDGSFVSHEVEKKEIKNTKGEVIGTIDQNVNYRVDQSYYYTVLQCKHCGRLSAEITVKQTKHEI